MHALVLLGDEQRCAECERRLRAERAEPAEADDPDSGAGGDFPCTETAWYEVSPASVAAAA